MEQTTLQQRIEERAKQRLLKDLLEAANKEREISALVGKERFPCKLAIRSYYSSYSTPRDQIIIDDEFSQNIFNSLLPNYISTVTEEILRKIDEIDWLVNSKNNDDLP